MAREWPAFDIEDKPPLAPVRVKAEEARARGELGDAMVTAFSSALGGNHKLTDDQFNIVGFSGRKFRMFLSNLIDRVQDPRYLEIGVLHGATFFSAIYKNRCRAVAVDSWDVQGKKHEPFFANYEKFKHPDADTDVVRKDFREVDYRALGPFNILFFDGPHNYQDQYDGVALPLPAMDKQFILMVDDWNWDRVRHGTYKALKELGLIIDYQIDVRTTYNNEPLPNPRGGTSDWNNGVFIGLLSKP